MWTYRNMRLLLKKLIINLGIPFHEAVLLKALIYS